MTNQTNEPKRSTGKERFLQNLQIVLWGALSLLFAVLTLLELIPAKSSGIEVKETVTVSSALINATQQNYVSAISGVLSNPTDNAIEVECVTVTVGNGKAEKTVELEGFILPPRFTQEISYSWEGLEEYDRVSGLSVTVNGEADSLTNAGSAMPVSGLLLVYLALLIVAAWFLVRAAKVRYYMHQEKRL